MCAGRYIHGDVKPENLCVGAECNGAQHRLYLLDLGLASRWRNAPQRTPNAYSQRPDDFRCCCCLRAECTNKASTAPPVLHFQRVLHQQEQHRLCLLDTWPCLVVAGSHAAHP